MLQTLPYYVESGEKFNLFRNADAVASCKVHLKVGIRSQQVFIPRMNVVSYIKSFHVYSS